MFDVKHNGNVYRYCKSDRGNYWIGVSGTRNEFYPGAYCHVPLAFCNELRKSAIEQGADKSIFKAPKKEAKKASVSRKKKKDEGSISIF
jgi:hypothetical protein|tara:strand:- start:5480 stop:5746 length:267 start_codon:yes stop_codon:yes gene_type:complete